jgi:hypothetical protein
LKRALIQTLWLPTLLLGPGSTPGDQPVFNEMPRWKGGWGVQAVHEFRTEDHFLLKDRIIGRDLTETVHLLHLEGVYTWDKSLRMTIKIPYVLDAKREIPTPTGKTTQRDEGLGDITVALPLKKYFNLSRRTGSYTFAPQVRVPASGDDSYEVYDNEWGAGLDVGYETETPELIFGISAGVWTFLGKEPLEASGSLDVGRQFILGAISGSVKWENDLVYENDGSTSLTYLAGPALYVRVTDTWHLRVSYKHDFYDRQGTPDHGRGDRLTSGVAAVF